MIENLMYLLLSVQIYALISGSLIKHVTIIAPIYSILISVGVTTFITFIFFVSQFNKLFTLLLILLLSFTLLPFGSFYNIIPFLALYLYIIEAFREHSILTFKHAIMVSPILLLEAIPIKWKGLFESNIGQKIHSILYATVDTHAVPYGGSGGIFNNSGTKNSIGVTIRVGKEAYKSMSSFQTFLILVSLIILMAIFILFIAKFYKTTKRSVFFKSMLTGIVVLIVTIFFAGVAFFKIFSAFKKALKTSTFEGFPNNGAFSTIPKGGGNLKNIIHSVVTSNSFSDSLRNFFKISSIILVIAAILFGTFLVYLLYKLLFSENIPQSILKNREVTKYRKKIKQKGIKESLKEIENPSEYVKFLYFSVLFLLDKKHFSIMKYETPNEFYGRVVKYSNIPVLYLDELTSLFDKTKYSNLEISETDVSFLKIHSNELLDSIKKIEFKKEKQHQQNTQGDKII